MSAPPNRPSVTQEARPPLNALIALAVTAGREIMAVRDAGVRAHDKLDGSPVTEADHRAEAVIIAGLARLCPGVPVLAEEQFAAGHAPELGARFFCVDPLDGTKDFIAAEGGSFTVNIGLIEHGAPTMGVVFAPATGALYAGEPGRALRGAWDARTETEQTPLAPIAVNQEPGPKSGPWRIAASRRHGDAKTNAFVEALGAVEEVRVSSSIKFCLCATGEIDLYPRFGDISEWDAAAGHAILLAAGGGMMRLTGEPVTYGRPDCRFLINGFIAYGAPAAEQEARRILSTLNR